jgi:HlyD family secretion protein
MSVFREKDAMGETRRVWWRERRVVITAVVILLLILVFAWRSCHKAADEGAPDIVVSVQVAKAERGAIAQEITTIATLAARQQADIAPKISAQIRELPLLVNRTVRAGDILVVLESRDLTAQRAEAAGAVTEAEAAARTTEKGTIPLTSAQDRKSVRDAHSALANAQKTYDRRKVLFEQGGISKKDLEAAQLAVVNAEDDARIADTSAGIHEGITNPGDATVATARASQARSRLANLDAQAGYAVIRAPFNGVVIEQFQHQGDFANPGTKILTIADASALIAKMEVSEATAATLKSGDAVTVIPDELPNERVTGTITLVGRGADAQSRSVEVWVAVPNAGGRLRPNGAAHVSIASMATNSAIVVPSSAVTLDATNASTGTVMVVDAKSVAHEVKVTTGIHSGGRTEIKSGLSGGETVVIEGNYGLPDGTKVALPGAGETAPGGKAPAAEPAEK